MLIQFSRITFLTVLLALEALNIILFISYYLLVKIYEKREIGMILRLNHLFLNFSKPVEFQSLIMLIHLIRHINYIKNQKKGVDNLFQVMLENNSKVLQIEFNDKTPNNNRSKNLQFQNFWSTIFLLQGESSQNNKQTSFNFKSPSDEIKPKTLCSYRIKRRYQKNDNTQDSDKNNFFNSVNFLNKDHQEISNSQQNAIKLQEKDEYQEQIQENFKEGRIYKLSETKHIIKNYGRAILRFIIKNKQLVSKVMQKKQVHQLNFMKFCRRMKKKLLTIKQLRSLWLDEQCQYARVIRIFSQYYIRKYSLHHIFNSRVVNFRFNVKYRAKLLEALKNPRSFTQIKEY